MVGYKATRVRVNAITVWLWYHQNKDNGSRRSTKGANYIRLLMEIGRCWRLSLAPSTNSFAINRHCLIAPRWGYCASFQDLGMSTSYCGWHFCVCHNETNIRGSLWVLHLFFQTVKFELALFIREKSKVAAKSKQNGSVDCCLTRKNGIEESLKEPPSVQLTPWRAVICGGGGFFILKL